MALDQIIKRHFWIVSLGVTGVTAFFGASGVSHFAAASLVPSAQDLAAPPPVVAHGIPGADVRDGRDVSFHTTSAEPILARNPFDSVTGPLHPKPTLVADSEPAAEPDNSDPRSAPPCDGVHVLAILASGDPEWSLAAFGGDSGKSLLERKGGQVSGKTIEYIGWDRVWFRSGASLCQAEMWKPTSEAPKPAASIVSSDDAPKVKSGAPAIAPDIAKGISKLSATEFNIDRTVVDKILENQADLMKQARIVPEKEDGKVVGIRMYGVRPDTLLGTLGMENGDRLQTINGFDVANPEKALEAYARLRTADQLTVNLNRRGQNVNLDYHIK